MNLFGRSAKPSFAAFATRQRSRKLQLAVMKANTSPKRASFEAMIGKPIGPVFAGELKAGQTFASFKKMDEGAKRMGLGRFFKRPRDYAKGNAK